jgi:hypothetical protein
MYITARLTEPELPRHVVSSPFIEAKKIRMGFGFNVQYHHPTHPDIH